MQGQGCCICHIALLSRFCIEIKPVSTLDVFHLSSPVLHIAEDPFIDGNLLLAQKTRLQSYNGTHVIPVVGSEMPGYKEGNGAEAMFRRINSFTSKNRTHTIVVDQYNHCLRFVDLGASTTSRLVGQCNLAGSYYPHIQMADATSAIFDHPTSIVVKDNADIFQFYLADSMNNAIHIILMPDATSDSVLVTRIEASMAFNKPEHLLIHTDSDHLIVADHSGISRVQLGGSYPVENIINDKRLYAIEFSSNEPRSVLALSKSLDDVMLLDVDDGSTESLCHCSNQWSDVCSQINQPVAVFRQKRRLSSDTYEVYISQADGIVMGEYKNSLLNGSGCHPLPSHSSLLFPATFSCKYQLEDTLTSVLILTYIFYVTA